MTHLPPFPALFELPSKFSQIITFIQKSNKPKQQWHIWLINLATFFWKTKKKRKEKKKTFWFKQITPFRRNIKALQEHIKQERKNSLLLQESWFHSTHEKKNTRKAIFAWNTWQHSTVWLKHKKGELPDGKSSVAL